MINYVWNVLIYPITLIRSETGCLTSLKLSAAVNGYTGVFRSKPPTWEPRAPAERIRHLNANCSFVIITVQLFSLHQITSPSAPLNTPVWNDNVETINKKKLLQFSSSQRYSDEGHLWDNGTHFSFEFHALNLFMQMTVNHTSSSAGSATSC